mmetsp:Transcript_16145/g.38712  ORF Transcript_16145/g.38712 Transcript_16145/m.38712 type:complete len:89 (+) Transcript_16145:79-345(+)
MSEHIDDICSVTLWNIHIHRYYGVCHIPNKLPNNPAPNFFFMQTIVVLPFATLPSFVGNDVVAESSSQMVLYPILVYNLIAGAFRFST